MPTEELEVPPELDQGIVSDFSTFGKAIDDLPLHELSALCDKHPTICDALMNTQSSPVRAKQVFASVLIIDPSQMVRTDGRVTFPPGSISFNPSTMAFIARNLHPDGIGQNAASHQICMEEFFRDVTIMLPFLSPTCVVAHTSGSKGGGGFSDSLQPLGIIQIENHGMSPMTNSFAINYGRHVQPGQYFTQASSAGQAKPL